MTDVSSHSRLRYSLSKPKSSPRRGFTIVEMMVVVAVILIILGMALPAAQTMWEQRKLIDAQNIVQGMLATARSKAIQAGDSETGLFFYLDQQGNQRIVPIRQTNATQLKILGFLQPMLQNDDTDITSLVYGRILSNVFEVSQDRGFKLSAPFRVVPRYVVEDKSTNPDDEDYDLFSSAELANNNFRFPPKSQDPVQRHRNFFTMIFSTTGHLRVGRDVLILDFDQDQNDMGDMTDLTIGYNHAGEIPDVTDYFTQRIDTPVDTIDPDLLNGTQAVPFLVIDNLDNPTALNFPSVDGLLVYDDAQFNEAGEADEKRDMLLRTAQPMYVNRWTGNVIMGPIGENAIP